MEAKRNSSEVTCRSLRPRQMPSAYQPLNKLLNKTDGAKKYEAQKNIDKNIDAKICNDPECIRHAIGMIKKNY